MTGRPALYAVFSLCFSVCTALAQAPAMAPAAPTVTVTATASGVRFAALGPVRQTRLEVYDESGSRVFDSDFLAGNVRDWAAQGRGLADGSYACVLTALDLAGRLSIKQGTVVISGGQVSLALGGAEPAGAVEAQQGAAHQPAVTPKADEGEGAATVATHDGRDGAVTATAGDLTLRTGDILSGADRERVRVTSDGRVGVGTPEPEAALDVAGAVRARDGIRFRDGTTLEGAGGRLSVRDADGTVTTGAAAATGTGTAGRIAKWAETGGDGTLADSALVESGGNVGLGTSSPSTLFEVNGAATFGTAGQGRARIDTSSPGNNLTFNVSGANGYLYFSPSSGFTIFKAPAGTPGQLQVESSGASPLSGAVRSWNGTTSANSPLLFYTAGMNPSTNQLQAGDIKFAPGLSFDLTTRIGNHSIFFSPSGTGNSVFENGNVGVGTANPQARLHVAGNVNFTGLRTDNAVYCFAGQCYPSPNVIGGTGRNLVTPGVHGATIAGGGDPVNSFSQSFPNHVTDSWGTIGGGHGNQAGDGAGTTQDQLYATVAGGQSNIARKAHSAVGGGAANVAEGAFSTIPGGVNNEASGTYSFAAGRKAKAGHPGAFVWGDSTDADISSSGANQFIIRAAGGVGIGTNAPASALHVRRDSPVFGTSALLTLMNGTGGEGAGAALDFSTTNTGANPASARIAAFDDGNFSADLGFWTKTQGAIGNSQVERMRLTSTGELGIGVSAPAARLHVSGGSIYVDGNGHGVILRSPNGTLCRRLTIDNAGALTTTAVACP